MTAHDSFWNWFIQHEVELFEFDPNQETERELLFDRLATEINKVHPDLTFEFGPQGPRREFVVSAAGIRDAFLAVARLVDAAPTLERWQITAFRPRRGARQSRSSARWLTERLAQAHANIRPYPPDDTEFLTTRLWDKYLPRWRRKISYMENEDPDSSRRLFTASSWCPLKPVPDVT